MTALFRAGAALAAASAAHLAPSVLTIPPLHRAVAPRLSGRSQSRHIALTFDDGPNGESTPAVLDALGALGAQATFFVLGGEVEARPDLAREIVERGHELAVHGWTHIPHLLRTPWGVYADLARSSASIRAVAGVSPRYWRPPNGVLTGTGFVAARRLGLRPVLWTADGQDWRADATPRSVLARLDRQLTAGGTVLLHDSDITSAPGSWHSTLGALPDLVDLCRSRGWRVGPLRDHWTEEDAA